VVANINKSRVEEQEDEEDAMLEDIPFACIICKGPYMEPVVTRCGHYFCQTCVLKRYRERSKLPGLRIRNKWCFQLCQEVGEAPG
jgi:Zinc finger, C3HC4 type (RING finger)